MTDFELLDDDGYPTEYALDTLFNWTGEVGEAIDFMRRLWKYAEWGITENVPPSEMEAFDLSSGRRYVKLATGGWSGNELVMDAVLSNARLALWCAAAQPGGLFIMEYPPK
jgi:hypothetical protein